MTLMSSATDPVAVHPQPDGPVYGPPYPEPPQQDRVTRFVQRKWQESPVWIAPAAMLVCMAGAVGYTVATSPTEANAGASPTCLLKYTTGFICPGCGGTRAAWYLLHGDIPAAARHHALFVFAVPFLLYMYFAWAGRRLFDLNYRIEIYVPAAQRLYGYYVLPFLLGERFAARLDLKADRRTGVLQVPAAWIEPTADEEETAAALVPELHRLAGWLGLQEVAAPQRGDLAGPLTAALKVASACVP